MSCNHDFNTEGFVIKCNLCEETFSDNDFNKEIQKRAGISFVEMQRQLQTKDARIKELKGELNQEVNYLGEFQYKEQAARIKELEGEVCSLKMNEQNITSANISLTQKLEVLTECTLNHTEDNRNCITERVYEKCQGCKNKEKLKTITSN